MPSWDLSKSSFRGTIFNWLLNFNFWVGFICGFVLIDFDEFAAVYGLLGSCFSWSDLLICRVFVFVFDLLIYLVDFGFWVFVNCFVFLGVLVENVMF